MTSFDVTITFCSQTAAILDPPSWISSIFQKPSKIAKIDQEVMKINKLTWKWCKNVKFASKRNNFLFKSLEIQNSVKTTCQKVVAMVTSNLIDKDLLHQIVPR